MHYLIKGFLLVSFISLLHSETITPKVLPENILGLKCLKLYKKYKVEKRHKAFAYVREDSTNKEECVYASDYKILEEAKNKAMKLCRNYVLNAECKFIDLDENFLAHNKEFSLLTPLYEINLTKDRKKELLTKASRLINGNCLGYFQKYLKEDGHKIFLYGINNNNFICVKSSSENTLKEAENNAFNYCNKIENKCKVFAYNTNIVAKSSDFNKTILPVVKVKLTDTMYKEYLSKAKSTIKEKSCLLQFKYYLESSQHKAFFITNSQNNIQACGRSEEMDNIEVAKSEALKKCLMIKILN